MLIEIQYHKLMNEILLHRLRDQNSPLAIFPSCLSL